MRLKFIAHHNNLCIAQNLFSIPIYHNKNTSKFVLVSLDNVHAVCLFNINII